MPKKKNKSSELSELYRKLKIPEVFFISQVDEYIVEIGRLIVSFQELDYYIEHFIHVSIWTDQNLTSLLVWNLEFSKKQIVLLDLHKKLESTAYENLKILNVEIDDCRRLRNDFVHSHWFFSQEMIDTGIDRKTVILQMNSQKRNKNTEHSIDDLKELTLKVNKISHAMQQLYVNFMAEQFTK